MISEKKSLDLPPAYTRSTIWDQKKNKKQKKTGLAVVIIFITRGQSQLVLKQ